MRIAIARVEPDDPRADLLLRAFRAEMAERYAGLGGRHPAPPSDDELRPPRGALLLALAVGRAVGRVGVVLLDDPAAAGGPIRAEIRQLHVVPEARGAGVGRRLTEAAMSAARHLGATDVVLFTAGRQPEALALYGAMGYAPVAPYADPPVPGPVFLGRGLGPRPARGDLVLRREASDAEPGATLLGEFLATVDDLYGRPEGPWPGAEPAELVPPHGAFLVGRVDGEPACCGAVRTITVEDGAPSAEVKRMYVREAFRGRGVAAGLLRGLEDEARALGHVRVRLDTGADQPEALALYLRAGYHRIAAYNENVRASYWLERAL